MVSLACRVCTSGYTKPRQDTPMTKNVKSNTTMAKSDAPKVNYNARKQHTNNKINTPITRNPNTNANKAKLGRNTTDAVNINSSHDDDEKATPNTKGMEDKMQRTNANNGKWTRRRQ